jgi:soluble lytic murein transglycosylase-like protein
LPPVEGGTRDVEEWRTLVEQYFGAELVDDALSVMRCESLGDPLAYNPTSGASGLFQFIPSTWAWASPAAGFGGASPFEPEANVGSASWLAQRSIDQGRDPWVQWSCKP